MIPSPNEAILALGNLATIGLITAAMASAYVVIGAVSDARRILRKRRIARLTGDLSVVLFSDEEVAAVVAERLVGMPASVLLPVLQRLAADLDGGAGRAPAQPRCRHRFDARHRPAPRQSPVATTGPGSVAVPVVPRP